MSGVNYLDQDTLDHCQQALRDGRTLEDIAGRLHIAPEQLARLLQLPVSQPAAQQDDDDYLWAADRLGGVL